jgi:multiple sugar transport system ATP-binding protein
MKDNTVFLWRNMMASVKLKEVFKKFGNGPTTIHNFNLEVDDNELVVICGPSGCGKTTVLRLISGLESITSGEIYIGNKLMNEVHPQHRDIAMVFQNQNLYPHMTVYENMAVSLRQKKVDNKIIDSQINEASKMLKIENILKSLPTNLSEGQSQRVAIGKALVRKPKVFLMDEPLTGLDAQLKYQLRDEILQLQQKLQTSMIYVTHDQVDAMSIGSRVVIMKDGAILQVDTPQMIYDNPVNVFVASFIGYPQMNFFLGDIRRIGETVGISVNNTYISIPESKTQKLIQSKNLKRAIIGIRPENIHIVNSNYQNTNLIYEGMVDYIERFGAVSHLKTTILGSKVTIQINSNTKLNIGNKVAVALDLNKAHIFDADTHNVISN